MKENLMKLLMNKYTKKILAIVILIVLIFVFIAGAEYYIKKKDGKEDSSDSKNGPATAKSFMQATTIDDDGNITFSQTISEYWEELKKNNNKLTKYLSSPEELAKLINAQVATQYLDTRSEEEIDDPIVWDEINKDVDSTSVQGIIKLKRALEDGTTITMTYVSPEKFQSYINEYNKSGSEKAKENALKHFTIEKTGSSASGSAGILTGSGNFTKYTDLTDAQIKALAVVCYHEQGSLKGAAAEASLMANLFEIKGSSYSSVYDYVKNSGWFAFNGYNMDTESIGNDYINVVKAVLVEGKRTIPGYIDEHDYVGDIISVTNNGESINKSDKSKYIQHVTKIKTVYGATYTFYSYPAENSDPFGYTSEEKRKQIGDAYYDYDTGVLMNGDGSTTSNTQNTDNDSNKQNTATSNTSPLHWPSPDSTYITSGFGPRNSPTAGASSDHKGIDIGASYGTEVQAAEAGTVVEKTSSDARGLYITLDHGNGVKTRYQHMSNYANLNVGDTVLKGQVVGYVGNTGVGTGTHLHFEIMVNDEPVNPLNYLYDNGMGNGTGGTGSNVQTGEVNTTSSTSEYVAKVATWGENQKITTTNDSSVEINDYHYYTMSTQTIPYHDFVTKYEMPFNYLWAMLLYSEDKDFVFDLADLVYGSEFEITIHDNLTITTNIVKNLYQKKTRYVTDAVNVKVTYTDYQDPQYSTSGGSDIPDEGESTLKETTVNVPGQKGEKTNIAPSSSEFYSVIETTINKTNTLDISLTKANAWCVDYEQEYTYEHTDKEKVGDSKTNLADTEEETDGIIYDNDPGGVAEEIRQRVLSEYSGHTTRVAKVTSSRTVCYYSTISRVRYTEDYLETSKYVSSPAKITEKTDKKAEEPNFVTILCGNYNARSNILSCESWLFGTLEDNEDTKDLLDLTKYLLYKATGHDYGVTEFDFSVFDPANFMSMNTGFLGNTIQEKVWFALKNEGYSDYAVAGAMGNIHWESGGFDPSAIEGGSGIGFGLCQWSYGRRDALEAFAKSRGVDPSDEDLQIEFLIGEMTKGGGADGYATFNFIPASGYDVWKNASSVEEATIAYMKYFERPGVPHEEERLKFAKKYYEEFHGKTLSVGSASNLLAAADKVARYIEQNNYTYAGTGGVNYTFPIQNSSRRTLSCSSYIQEVLLQAGYTQFAGGEKLWATTDKNAALGYLTKNGVNAILLPGLNNLQPGDILQSGVSGNEHVVMVYAVNGNNITTKGVPEVLNNNYGFNGKVRTISNLNAYNYYAIRITN